MLYFQANKFWSFINLMLKVCNFFVWKLNFKNENTKKYLHKIFNLNMQEMKVN